MPTLIFSEKGHLYEVDGNRVPSVTQIIGDFIKVNNLYVNVFTGASIKADVFEKGAETGTAIHKMIDYYLDGDLDREALSPELEAVLQQFERWMSDYKPEIIDHETMLYSEKYGFAGTRDIKCLAENRLYIVDIKTGAFAMAGPQLAAYVQLDKENDRSHRVRHRAVLHLDRKGGDYRFIPFTDQNDWQFFVSRLNTYNYLGGGNGQTKKI